MKDSFELSPSNIAIGLGVGLFLGIAASAVLSRKTSSISPVQKPTTLKKSKKKNPPSFDYDLSDDFKMVLAVRTDLKMGPGKVASQCSHGAVGAYQIMMQYEPNVVRAWERNCGSKKIVLKVPSLNELDQLREQAREIGLPFYYIEDAGRTQIEPGSATVLAIGPG